MLPSAKPIYLVLDPDKNDGMKYVLLESLSYYSKRYKKWVHLMAGMLSDGATGAKDLPKSLSWWVHDKLTGETTWADGTPCTNWQASQVLSDILDEEGREIRKWTWKWMTFLFGGKKIKKRVGWF